MEASIAEDLEAALGLVRLVNGLGQAIPAGGAPVQTEEGQRGCDDLSRSAVTPSTRPGLRGSPHASPRSTTRTLARSTLWRSKG